MNNGILTQAQFPVAMPYGLLGDPAPVPLIDRAYAYDPDAATYIRRVESADNAPLELAVRVAINEFIKGCKVNNIWGAIKASCILAGARTLAGALVPLVGTAPTSVNFVGGDYNRKTGLEGNGSTKYLDSNRNNNADPQNSKHLAVYATVTTAALNQAYAGTSFGTGFTSLNTLNTTTVSCTVNVNSSAVGCPNAIGFIGANRPASAVQQARGAGVTSSNGTGSQTPRNASILILNAAPARLAFYSIGESLDLALLDTSITKLINTFALVIP